ncbi:isatin hydrolase-like [Ruditapes philippinarum]|uniref:isatin hydrolase-like n=1 Tax=Ruditapes philippinarum TaxID=129788 RepID=UPI00295B625B|nr:isatin hydrolase-like [Ruditapes philippinarum]
MQLNLIASILLVCNFVEALDVKVVELSYELGPETLFYPGSPPFVLTILHRGITGAYWFELNKFEAGEHVGTHLDAPSHFSEGKLRMHEIPMEKLIGPGVIIDVKDKVEGNPDFKVSIGDIIAWEMKHKKIPECAIVIMNSGWGKNYPNKALTFGTPTPEDPSTFHYPGWHTETVDWLIKTRHVCVVGTDTPSNDPGDSTSFPVHQTLGAANVPGLENVANLDSVPESGSTIYVAPIKLKDGSGAQARVFATFSNVGKHEYYQEL